MNRTLHAAATALALAGLAAGGCSFLGGNSLGETEIETQFQASSVDRIKAADDLAGKLSEIGLNAEQTKATIATLTRPLPERITLRDGKDKASVTWNVNIAEGTADYTANDVVSTDAAKWKARIAKNAGDDAVKAIEQSFEGGVKGLVNAIQGAGGG